MTEVYVPPSDFKVEFSQGSTKGAPKDAGAKQRELWMVPLDKLVVHPNLNVRIHDADYEEHVEEIKNSIIENGFYSSQPLAGYAGKEGDVNFIYVTGGFTRLEAAKRAVAAGAPIETVPVLLKPPGTSMLDLMFALDVENTSNRLRPYERAIVAKRAIGYGADEATVAKKMGITEQYVRDLLYLMGLPRALQGAVIAGNVSATHAVQLARKVGPSEALKAFEASLPTRSEEGSETGAERVTPRDTTGAARAPGKKGPVIPKKTLLLAIDYAIALPDDGIAWLAKWRKGDTETVAELASYKPPRKARTTTGAKKASKKTGGKPGRPKGSGKTKPKDDPVFETHSEDAPL